MRKTLLAGCVLALAACGSHTSVQSGYGDDRDACQSESEEKLPQFIDPNKPVSIKERNAKLVTLFSDCMFAKGWTVATPTRAGGQGFKADPGVGVGASVRPGRFSTDEDDDFRQPPPQFQAQPVDPSPAAPQNQGAVVESPDLITDQGGPGVVRKVPTENPVIAPPQ